MTSSCEANLKKSTVSYVFLYIHIQLHMDFWEFSLNLHITLLKGILLCSLAQESEHQHHVPPSSAFLSTVLPMAPIAMYDL